MPNPDCIHNEREFSGCVLHFLWRGTLLPRSTSVSYNSSMHAIAANTSVRETHLGIGTRFRGKVRDCYRFDKHLLIVSTDRISAFDWVLPTPIPDKGRVLTAISAFWFDWLSTGPDPIAHHLITTDIDAMSELAAACLPAGFDRESLRGRQ